MFRKFSKREKALLVILAVLLVLAAYYLMVLRPVDATISSATTRKENAETSLIMEKAKVERLRQMQEELSGVSDSHMSEIPYYDNTRNVLATLNTTLMGKAETYDITFSPVTFEGNIARRSVNMSFTCDGYATARSIVDSLYNCPYRCEVSSLTLLSSSGEKQGDIFDSSLTAKVTVTFFELVESQG